MISSDTFHAYRLLSLFMKTSAFLATLLVAASVTLSGGQYVPAVLLERSLDALDRVLEFLIRHNDDLLADTLFGVLLARSQMQVVLTGHPLTQPLNIREISVYFKIRKLKEKSEEFLRAAKPTMRRSQKPETDAMLDVILDVDLWEIHEPIKVGKLLDKGKDGSSPVFDMYQRLLELEDSSPLFNYATPNETSSDRCIADMLRNRNRPTCEVSSPCWDIETGGERRALGYSLTHRLIFMQIARQIGCKNEPYFHNIDDRIEDLCAEILTEAEVIDILGFPDMFVDLFIEQVVLCGGVEGYAEFLRLKWMDLILSMQREVGCYGDYRENDLSSEEDSEENRRRKRSEDVMEDGCLMHLTGVATAALASNVRALVELDPGFSPKKTHTNLKLRHLKYRVIYIV